MPTLAPPAVPDAPRGFGLTAVGLAAMIVAALGTVVFAPPAATDPPSSGTCQMDVAQGGGWTGTSCTSAAGADAGR